MVDLGDNMKRWIGKSNCDPSFLNYLVIKKCIGIYALHIIYGCTSKYWNF